MARTPQRGRSPRRNWGFQSWSEHDAATWRELLNEADRRAELAKGRVARIVATDPSGDAVSCTRRILKAAGLADRVIFAQPDLDKISRKLMMPACCGGEPRGFVFLDTTETAISKMSRLADRVIFAQPDLDKISRKLMMPACCGGEPRGFVFLDTTETAISKMSRVLDLATSLHAGACGADPVPAPVGPTPSAPC